jgi:hypothetical protein
MAIVEEHTVSCPCGETISLTGNNLARIVQHLQWSNMAAPLVNFVCWRCKTAFRYDYQNRKPSGVIDEPPQTLNRRVGVLTVGCAGANCEAPIELIAVRTSDTTDEQFHEEAKG